MTLLLLLYTQQVETVGDKYMAVSGLPDECENHAVSIARLALDMIDKADSVKMGNHPIVSRSGKDFIERIYPEGFILSAFLY